MTEPVKAGNNRRGYQWTLVTTHPTRGRIFRRPLSPFELSFVWDGRFNGNTDSLKHVTLRLLKDNDGGDKWGTPLFSRNNVVRAWLDMKRRFPLMGATIETISDWTSDNVAHFVVTEADLSAVRPGEIEYGEVASAEDAQQHAITLLDNDSSAGRTRQLSDVLLVRLYVFRETALTGDDDSVVRLHILALMSHCITDGTANYSFLRCFLDALARGAESELPTQHPLEERLAMAAPSCSAELEPAYVQTLSRARQWWRRAIALVIYQLRSARIRGGHTLPWRYTSSTPYIAARTAQVNVSLSQEEIATVLASCRLHNLTFGNAYYVLAQVAMTRVLYRRYLCGAISNEEWEYRKRQPFIIWGPINLRRFLNKAWFERGGGGEFVMCLGVFTYQLPFMTLGNTEQHYVPRDGGHLEHDTDRAQTLESVSDNNVPQFSELLTFDRFLHRVGLVKKQATAYSQHPLFLEIVQAGSVKRLQGSERATLKYQENIYGKSDMQANADNGILPVTDMPMAFAYGGASLGNVDAIFPSEYPLPPSHPLSPYAPVAHHGKAGYATLHRPASTSQVNPTIVVEHTGTRLHAAPAKIYLGTWTLQGQLQMALYYDNNVFEEEVMKEWLEELKGALLWYLGQMHPLKSDIVMRKEADITDPVLVN